MKKTWALALCSTLFSQVALGASTEANLWAERRRNLKPKQVPVEYAGLPASMTLPAVKSALPFTPVLNSVKKATVSTKSKDLQKLLESIPQSVSTIQSIHDSGDMTAPPVVLIQDVHMNVEAQTNIAAVLQDLIDQDQVGFVGVEGVFETFDFTPFREVPYKNITQDMAKALFEKNLLAAPSYVGIASQKTPPLMVGVDDLQHYKANVRAVLNSRNLKKKALQKIQEDEARLEREKKTFFSSDLLAFDGHRTAYQKGALGVGAYLHQLISMGAQEDFVVEQFLEAYRMEATLDFKKVEDERKTVIEKLTRTLNQEELSRLVKQSLSYRMGRMGFGEYYGWLKNLCENKGITLGHTPHFDNYIRYVLLSDGINAEPFFKSLRKMEDALSKQLATTAQQKDLLDQSHHLSLTAKLIDFSLTPEEWEEYRHSSKSWNPVVEDKTGSRIKSGMTLQSFEQFYEQADIRSVKIVENLVKIQNPQHKPVVLIAGGFHSEHLSQLLKEQKISYVIVSPKITKIDSDSGSAYLSVFSRENMPLDQLMEGERLFLAPIEGQITHPTRSIPCQTGPKIEYEYPGRQIAREVEITWAGQTTLIRVPTDITDLQAYEVVKRRSGLSEFLSKINPFKFFKGNSEPKATLIIKPDPKPSTFKLEYYPEKLMELLRPLLTGSLLSIAELRILTEESIRKAEDPDQWPNNINWKPLALNFTQKELELLEAPTLEDVGIWRFGKDALALGTWETIKKALDEDKKVEVDVLPPFPGSDLFGFTSATKRSTLTGQAFLKGFLGPLTQYAAEAPQWWEQGARQWWDYPEDFPLQEFIEFTPFQDEFTGLSQIEKYNKAAEFIVAGRQFLKAIQSKESFEAFVRTQNKTLPESDQAIIQLADELVSADKEKDSVRTDTKDRLLIIDPRTAIGKLMLGDPREIFNSNGMAFSTRLENGDTIRFGFTIGDTLITDRRPTFQKLKTTIHELMHVKYLPDNFRSKPIKWSGLHEGIVEHFTQRHLMTAFRNRQHPVIKTILKEDTQKRATLENDPGPIDQRVSRNYQELSGYPEEYEYVKNEVAPRFQDSDLREIGHNKIWTAVENRIVVKSASIFGPLTDWLLKFGLAGKIIHWVLNAVIAPLWETGVFHAVGYGFMVSLFNTLGLDPVLSQGISLLIIAVVFSAAHTIVEWMTGSDKGKRWDNFKARFGLSLLFNLPFAFLYFSPDSKFVFWIAFAVSSLMHGGYNALVLAGKIKGPLASIGSNSDDDSDFEASLVHWNIDADVARKMIGLISFWEGRSLIRHLKPRVGMPSVDDLRHFAIRYQYYRDATPALDEKRESMAHDVDTGLAGSSLISESAIEDLPLRQTAIGSQYNGFDQKLADVLVRLCQRLGNVSLEELNKNWDEMVIIALADLQVTNETPEIDPRKLERDLLAASKTRQFSKIVAQLENKLKEAAHGLELIYFKSDKASWRKFKTLLDQQEIKTSSVARQVRELREFITASPHGADMIRIILAMVRMSTSYLNNEKPFPDMDRDLKDTDLARYVEIISDPRKVAQTIEEFKSKYEKSKYPIESYQKDISDSFPGSEISRIHHLVTNIHFGGFKLGKMHARSTDGITSLKAARDALIKRVEPENVPAETPSGSWLGSLIGSGLQILGLGSKPEEKISPPVGKKSSSSVVSTPSNLSSMLKKKEAVLSEVLPFFRDAVAGTSHVPTLTIDQGKKLIGLFGNDILEEDPNMDDFRHLCVLALSRNAPFLRFETKLGMIDVLNRDRRDNQAKTKAKPGWLEALNQHDVAIHRALINDAVTWEDLYKVIDAICLLQSSQGPFTPLFIKKKLQTDRHITSGADFQSKVDELRNSGQGLPRSKDLEQSNSGTPILTDIRRFGKTVIWWRSFNNGSVGVDNEYTIDEFIPVAGEIFTWGMGEGAETPHLWTALHDLDRFNHFSRATQEAILLHPDISFDFKIGYRKAVLMSAKDKKIKGMIDKARHHFLPAKKVKSSERDVMFQLTSHFMAQGSDTLDYIVYSVLDKLNRRSIGRLKGGDPADNAGPHGPFITVVDTSKGGESWRLPKNHIAYVVPDEESKLSLAQALGSVLRRTDALKELNISRHTLGERPITADDIQAAIRKIRTYKEFTEENPAQTSGGIMTWLGRALGMAPTVYAKHAFWIENLFVFAITGLLTLIFYTTTGEWSTAVQIANVVSWIIFSLGHLPESDERLLASSTIAAINMPLGFVFDSFGWTVLFVAISSTAVHFLTNFWLNRSMNNKDDEGNGKPSTMQVELAISSESRASAKINGNIIPEIGSGTNNFVFQVIAGANKKALRISKEPIPFWKTRSIVSNFKRLERAGLSKFYGHGSTNDNQLYILSEWIDGQTIDEITQTRSLSPAESRLVLDLVLTLIKERIYVVDFTKYNVMIGRGESGELKAFLPDADFANPFSGDPYELVMQYFTVISYQSRTMDPQGIITARLESIFDEGQPVGTPSTDPVLIGGIMTWLQRWLQANFFPNLDLPTYSKHAFWAENTLLALFVGIPLLIGFHSLTGDWMTAIQMANTIAWLVFTLLHLPESDRNLSAASGIAAANMAFGYVIPPLASFLGFDSLKTIVALIAASTTFVHFITNFILNRIEPKTIDQEVDKEVAEVLTNLRNQTPAEAVTSILGRVKTAGLAKLGIDGKEVEDVAVKLKEGLFSGPITDTDRVFIMDGREKKPVMIAAILMGGINQENTLRVPEGDDAYYRSIADVLTKLGRKVSVQPYKNLSEVGVNEKNMFDPTTFKDHENLMFILGAGIDYSGKEDRVKKLKDLIPEAQRQNLENLERIIRRILTAA